MHSTVVTFTPPLVPPEKWAFFPSKKTFQLHLNEVQFALFFWTEKNAHFMVAHGLLGATLIFLGLHAGEIWPWPLRPSRVIFWRALALENIIFAPSVLNKIRLSE